MRQHVPPEQLWTEFEGDLKFEYDHEAYWPALIKMCEDKHAELQARWVKAGKNYGESETYLKGGDVPSVTGFKADQVASGAQGDNEESAGTSSNILQTEAAETHVVDSKGKAKAEDDA